MWGEISRTRPNRPWGPLGTGSFPEVKRPGRRVDHTPSSSAEVKERVSYTSTATLGLRGLLYFELHGSTKSDRFLKVQ